MLSISCLYGRKRVFPIWGFERIVGVDFESQQPHSHVVCCIAELYYDVPNILRFAVNFAVLWKGI